VACDIKSGANVVFRSRSQSQIPKVVPLKWECLGLECWTVVSAAFIRDGICSIAGCRTLEQMKILPAYTSVTRKSMLPRGVPTGVHQSAKKRLRSYQSNGAEKDTSVLPPSLSDR
jgi:hypothetical protein